MFYNSCPPINPVQLLGHLPQRHNNFPRAQIVAKTSTQTNYRTFNSCSSPAYILFFLTFGSSFRQRNGVCCCRKGFMPSYLHLRDVGVRNRVRELLNSRAFPGERRVRGMCCTIRGQPTHDQLI